MNKIDCIVAELRDYAALSLLQRRKGGIKDFAILAEALRRGAQALESGEYQLVYAQRTSLGPMAISYWCPQTLFQWVYICGKTTFDDVIVLKPGESPHPIPEEWKTTEAAT